MVGRSGGLGMHIGSYRPLIPVARFTNCYHVWNRYCANHCLFMPSYERIFAKSPKNKNSNRDVYIAWLYRKMGLCMTQKKHTGPFVKWLCDLRKNSVVQVIYVCQKPGLNASYIRRGINWNDHYEMHSLVHQICLSLWIAQFCADHRPIFLGVALLAR